MHIADWLAHRGVPEATVDALLQYLPDTMSEMPFDVFCDAETIMDPDRWFYWPEQNRFVMVGQCPNGDGVAIDTVEHPGTVYYVAHELIRQGYPLEQVVIQVADCPSEYFRKQADKDFPYDYWEAKEKHRTNGSRRTAG